MSGRILVVDDVATNRVLLKAKLATAYYTVTLAQNGAEALSLAQADPPDLILLDVMMPEMDGFEVCRRLKSMRELAHIPVVMVTSLNTAEERIRGLEAGADDFLSKPLVDLALFARVRNLMRMKIMFDELRMRDATTQDLGFEPILLDDDGVPEGGHVLFVGDRMAQAEGWAADIRDRLPVRTSAVSDGLCALRLADRDLPDAIVISQRVNGGQDGRRLVSALRSRADTRQSAIILAVDGEDLEVAAHVLDLGANDYILCPFDPSELAARLRSQLRRKRYSERLRANVRDGLMMAMRDPLTGLFNRRYAAQHLRAILARSRDSGRAFATMMLDLDRFKAVNDRFGHDAGDEVLKEFGRRLRENVRGADLVARLGGEEFFVAMPDTDAAAAAQIAERIRAAVEQPLFRIDRGARALQVTVSIGVSLADPGISDVDTLLKRADEALYASKHAGRNRVTFAAAA